MIRRLWAWFTRQRQCPICYAWLPSYHIGWHIADEHTDSEINAWLETLR